MNEKQRKSLKELNELSDKIQKRVAFMKRLKLY